jgi:bifunctional non-homologous end joining protein LigD
MDGRSSRGESLLILVWNPQLLSSASAINVKKGMKTRARESLPPRTTSTKTSKNEVTLQIKGRSVPVSKLDKIFYPQSGFTKGEVIDYYIRISPVLLPHLKDRALTLKRYPDGVAGGFFYEKRCPSYRPAWIQTVPIWTERYEEDVRYCLANDLPSIVWAANLGDLELHTLLAKGSKVDCPTMMVFDLDPGPPANILDCAEVALWVKEYFDNLKLETFIKTSGSKGLQLYVPLNAPTTYDVTKPFARSVAERMEREHPDRVVSKMEKRLRVGKVLVDWSQNDRHKTTVCVYSLRAKERPTVSTPLRWEEVGQALKKRKSETLSFLWDAALERVESEGDLFAPVLKLKQKLPAKF